MAKKNAAVLDRDVTDVKKPDYRQPKIDVFQVFGFKEALTKAIETGEPFVLEDHPKFPNPRTEFSEKSLKVIDNIIETGQVREPVKLYFYQEEDGNTSYIPTDGKTRLTGIGRRMQQNPDDTETLRMIDYIPHRDTEENVRGYMAATNYDRENLSDLQMAKHFLFLQEGGATEEDILKTVGRVPNAGTTRWLREMLALAQSPTLVGAVTAGEIQTTTGKAIAESTKDLPPEEREEQNKAKVNAVVEEKNKQVAAGEKPDERKAAQDAGVRRTNKGVLTLPEISKILDDQYPEMKRAMQRNKREEDINWNDKNDRDDYINDVLLMERFWTLARVLKLVGSLYDIVLYIETNILSDEAKAEVVPWMPPKPAAEPAK